MIHKLILESWIQIGYFYREGHSRAPSSEHQFENPRFNSWAVFGRLGSRPPFWPEGLPWIHFLGFVRQTIFNFRFVSGYGILEKIFLVLHITKIRQKKFYGGF